MGMVSQLRQAATTSREGACTIGRTRISAPLDGPTVEHAHAQPLLNHRHNGVVIGDLARHMRRQPVRGKRVKYQALLTLI